MARNDDVYYPVECLPTKETRCNLNQLTDPSIRYGEEVQENKRKSKPSQKGGSTRNALTRLSDGFTCRRSE